MSNKILFSVLILPLLFSCISCSKDLPARVVEQDEQGKSERRSLYADRDLGYCKVGYYYRLDLNNDGKEEIVEVTEPYKFYTNLPDSVWGDDTGAVIRILNRKGEVVYLKDLDRYQPIEEVSIGDVDGDGLNEVMVSIGKTEDQVAKTYIYGWKDNEYKIIAKRIKHAKEKPQNYIRVSKLIRGAL
ncbi:MAG: VCBS repeat-containing protein [Candidatus Omnitrophica bacterium]|nr:VCBS repeat-containing protein [Candidatus Omnitrophota bacterium]